ncbi:MAG: hypothetical protein CR975_03765 [Gammaproteobacteria bacterium]|nr:MAG: hypothetical protein CR975_03765 [Gammaproteobacteria bacterium]
MNKPASAVNFYILSDSDLQHRLLFVCRLVEKAFEQQLPTLIITADNEQLQTLNRLIWAFKPERFIPHDIINKQLTTPLPSILLSNHVDAVKTVDFQPQVVIDLGYDATPLDFPKIMLVANQYQEILANARMKYQSYVDNGIKPTVHKIP